MKFFKYIPSLLILLAPLSAFALSNTYNFPDPFSGASISEIVGNVIRALLSLVGALFFVMFLWGGAQYLTAGGDAEKVNKGKTTLVNAIIGLVIVALSYVIVVQIIDVIVAGGTGQGQTPVPLPEG